MIEKSHILKEIKRTADGNAGKPLGKGRFYRETGIRESDWCGKYWARWGDALTEAGFSPNQMTPAYTEEHLLESFASLIKELGSFPVAAEVRMKARKGSRFPSRNTFNRFGAKHELAARVVEFCRGKDDYLDVVSICLPLCGEGGETVDDLPESSAEFGSVYLIRSGKYFKIGRTNSTGRRGYELGIQLPEKATHVHAIKTDDPAGIEAYWHKRFEKSRKHGEWFELTSEQVSDFRRRKFM